MAFLAIPTLAGQAAIAAAIDPDNPVALVISEMVVGDGNGNPVTPLETQTSLVNQTAVVPIAETARNANKLTIDALLDETVGGFTIREAGVLDQNGTLLFVASIPATQKMTVAEQVEDILTLGLIIIVSDTAQVVISTEGTTYATHDYVNQAIANLRTHIGTPLRPYHIAVKSMAVAIPPSAPTPGDTYIIAADATGAWAGQSGKLTQYIGAATWIFVTCPLGHVVGNEADGLLYQRVVAGWLPLFPASPNRTLWLHSSSGGVRGWSDPFDINALTTRPLAGNDLIAFHDVSVGEKSKATVEALIAAMANSDYLHSEMFFLGSQ